MSFTKKMGTKAQRPLSGGQPIGKAPEAVETPRNTVAKSTIRPAPRFAEATQNSGCLSGALLFEGHRDGCVRRQADLLAFDVGDQPQIDEMMVSLVIAFAAIGAGELDPATFNAIDGSDVNAVRADHFHVLLYVHFKSPPSC